MRCRACSRACAFLARRRSRSGSPRRFLTRNPSPSLSLSLFSPVSPLCLFSSSLSLSSHRARSLSRSLRDGNETLSSTTVSRKVIHILKMEEASRIFSSSLSLSISLYLFLSSLGTGGYRNPLVERLLIYRLNVRWEQCARAQRVG